jgi:hypothetical protein
VSGPNGLTVRPPAPADELVELHPVWGPRLDCVEPYAPGALAVLDGRRPVGLVVARPLGPGLCVEQLHLADGAGPEVLLALAATRPGQRIELNVLDPSASDGSGRLEALAAAAGFRLVHRHIRFGRDLAGVAPPVRRLMRRWACERYEDATAEDNLAMARIFTAAGCAPIGSTALHVRYPDTPPPPAPNQPVGSTGPLRLPRGAHVSLLRKVPASRATAHFGP